MGWRYLLFLLGGMTLALWGIRFFLFELVESPRYLVGKGQDQEAVAVIHKIAAFNHTVSSLTVDQLRVASSQGDKSLPNAKRGILSRTSHYSADHVKALFRTAKIAYSTSLLIALWGELDSRSTAHATNLLKGMIGLASTLYNNFLPYLYVCKSFSYIGIASNASPAVWPVEEPTLGTRPYT